MKNIAMVFISIMISLPVMATTRLYTGNGYHQNIPGSSCFAQLRFYQNPKYGRTCEPSYQYSRSFEIKIRCNHLADIEEGHFHVFRDQFGLESISFFEQSVNSCNMGQVLGRANISVNWISLNSSPYADINIRSNGRNTVSAEYNWASGSRSAQRFVFPVLNRILK